MNIDRPTRGLRMPWKSRKAQQAKSSERTIVRRVPLLDKLPMKVKGHLVACAGEFVGTFMFLLFAFGGTNTVNTAPKEGVNAVADDAANPAKLLYISLCFGMSLAVNAWVFFRISGGLFNPAVTFGMMLIGAVDYVRGALIFVAQILGAISAAAVVAAMFPNPLSVRTTLGGGTSIVQGLFIEMFLTAQLVFTIFMLAAEKHSGTFIAPVGIGLSLFIAELMGVYYTGGSLNPARSFAPAVVVHEFSGYHWIYWLGPMMGAALASAFYMFVKALEYETVNEKKKPEDVVGARFDPHTGQEKLVTHAGGELDALSHTAAQGRYSTGDRTLIPNHVSATNRPDGYRNGPDLEAGRPGSSPTAAR